MTGLAQILHKKIDLVPARPGGWRIPDFMPVP